MNLIICGATVFHIVALTSLPPDNEAGVAGELSTMVGDGGGDPCHTHP